MNQDTQSAAESARRAMPRIAEALRQAGARAQAMVEPIVKANTAVEEAAHRDQQERQHARSEATVEALAMFLLHRDWPSVEPRDLSLRYEYRCLAAAILAGEVWAMRKAWPEAITDAQGRSEWAAPEQRWQDSYRRGHTYPVRRA